MGIRKVPLEIDEYYHIYNRGTDKRKIVLDKEDLDRFLDSLDVFNNEIAFGSIYESKYKKTKKLGTPTSKWGNRSSLDQYINASLYKHNHKVQLSNKIILDSYKSSKEYLYEATRIVNDIILKRDDLEELLIDRLASRSSK